MADDCVFCRIASGALPVPFVAHNDVAVAFRDMHPQAPVHVLVVPRRHVASLLGPASSHELAGLLSLAAEVARVEGVSESGFRTVINTGDDGGQTVHHLHLHVLGGRAMGWPPG